MKNVERYRDGQEISWPFAFALGVPTAASATLFHLDLPVAALISLAVVAVICLGTVALRPKQSFRTATVVRTTSDADYPPAAHWRAFLPTIGIFVAGVGLEPTSLDPTVAVPVYAVAMTASSTWMYRRTGTEDRRIGQRRAQAALEKADLAEATGSRLTVAEEHRGVLAGLVVLGAVDGIQVRLWRLAEVTGAGIDVLREKIAGLSRAGVVRTSAVDAGNDPGRVLAELTPVGVRVLHELRRR